MNNVVKFPQKNSARNATGKSSGIDQLRGTTRVDRMDRVVLAQNLGKIAENLGVRPLEGSRQILLKAGDGDSYLKKRKRFIRLANEEGPDPYDDGSYASSGAAWAKVIETAAELKSGTTANANGWVKDGIVSNLLWGTTFNPDSQPLPSGIEGARTLIDQFAARLSSRVGEETRLRELHDILQSTPFELGITNQDPIIEAEGEDVGLPSVQGVIDQVFPRTIRGRAPDTNWAIPMIRIGYLVRRHHQRIFKLPPEIREIFDRVEIEAGKLEPKSDYLDELKAWLTSIGATERSPRYWMLPEESPFGSSEYGWKTIQCEYAQPVYLGLESRDKGIAPFLKTFGEDIANLTPTSVLYDLTKEALERYDRYHPFQVGMISDEIGLEILRWPEWIKKVAPDHADQPNDIFGILDLSCFAPFQTEDFVGWLDDNENMHLNAIIFGSDPQMYFIPTIAQGEGLPEVCRPDSIASALLKNLGANKDSTVFSRLVELSRLIGDLGCSHHERSLKAYQGLLKDI